MAGCASTGLRREDFAQVQGSLVACEQLGAKGIPQAALHYQLAKEEYERSLMLLADNRDHRASLMIQRSQADADIAMALARAHELDEAAHDAGRRYQDFQRRAQENSR